MKGLASYRLGMYFHEHPVLRPPGICRERVFPCAETIMGPEMEAA